MSHRAFILTTLMLACLLALGAQVAIDFSTANLASASLVVASSLAVLLYLQWTPALHTHPLSAFALLGFCVTTQMGALLGQTLYGASLAANLRQPIETFATLAFFQAVALVAHLLYRWVVHPVGEHLAEREPSLPRQLLQRLGLYEVPTTGTLWFMGYVGLVAFVLGAGRESTFGKVMQGLSFLTWAPFLIPMYLLQWGERYGQARRLYPHLLFFAGLVVLLGLAANARGIMLSGFVTIGLFALLNALRSERPVQARQVFRLLGWGAALAALAVPVSELATAMVVARKDRGYISAPQMVRETFRHLSDPAALQAERERVRKEALGKYDEFYFANPLLARLVETKFHDNALYYAGTLSQSDKAQLADTSIDLLWATLPDPVLKALKVNVDKRDLEFSMGDYLAHLSQGGPLGSRRTGSMFAQGWALMGVGFVAFYFVACLVMFSVLDLLTARSWSGAASLSAVAMLAVWKVFQYGMAAESLSSWLSLVVRTLPQNAVLFLLMLFIARAAAVVLGRQRRAMADETPALT